MAAKGVVAGGDCYGVRCECVCVFVAGSVAFTYGRQGKRIKKTKRFDVDRSSMCVGVCGTNSALFELQ